MARAEALRLRDAEHRVIDLCARATTTADLIEALVPLLRRAIHADAAFVGATDPDTTVISTAAVIDNLPTSLCVPWFHNEYLVEDVNKFADLHRELRPAATLHRATAGHPELSPRHEELYRPLGLGPEVRTTYSLHGSCWGVASLVREAGSPDFSEEELAWLQRVDAPIAAALGRTIVAPPTNQADAVPPGIVTLDTSGRILSMSPHAADLLAELDAPAVELAPDEHLPGQAYMVVTAVRARAAGRLAVTRPTTRVRGRSGRWLTVRGDYTRTPSGELVNIVLVIEPSHPSEIMPILVASYGLSAREQEVLVELAAGRRTDEIAAMLFISEHTVRDHIKSILAKTGTSSRGELLSLLFHRHSYPQTEFLHH